MEKIFKRLMAMAMVAIAAFFITASFASCTDDEENDSHRSSSNEPAEVTSALAVYHFKFTTDFLKVADVTLTYTDSLGQEHVDPVIISSPNSKTQQFFRKVFQPKLPATFMYKLTIKMKDKKDIPVQSVYQLGWNDTFCSVAPVDSHSTVLVGSMQMLMQSPFHTSSVSNKKVTFDELENAFKNSINGFESIGTAKTTITVVGSKVTVER